MTTTPNLRHRLPPCCYRISLLALLVISLGAVLAFILTAPRKPVEPVYQGKKLSDWLDATRSTDAGPIVLSEASVRAVREMGTNALPAMLAMLRASDSQLKMKLAMLFDRHPLLRVHIPSNAEKRFRAIHGFRALGLMAKPVFPQIVELVLSSDYNGEAINSLTEADADAIALLAKGVGSPDPKIRNRTVFALSCLRKWPSVAIPALMTALNDRDTEVRASAARALGFYGDMARIGIPELTRLSRDGNQRISSAATESLF